MMDYEVYKKAIFQEITRRTAQRIREAHQRGDDLRKCVELVEHEVHDGSELMQAIKLSHQVFPDYELQKELTEIMKGVTHANT